MVERLESFFPRLQGSAYQITSPADDLYNCIAWAAGVVDQWWWPDAFGARHWPPGVPRAETLAAFQAAFALLGYEPCADEGIEPGREKIAIFADTEGFPRHAARQFSNGRWTSKLGELEDIEHALHDLEGEAYGTVVLLLKRPTPAT